MRNRYSIPYQYSDGTLGIVRRSDHGAPLNVTVRINKIVGGGWEVAFTTTNNPQWDAQVARTAIGHIRHAGGNFEPFHIIRQYRRTDLPGHVAYTFKDKPKPQTYTVRTMADGDHYLPPRTFNSRDDAEVFAEEKTNSLYDTGMRLVEITVDVADDTTGDVLWSHTLPHRETFDRL